MRGSGTCQESCYLVAVCQECLYELENMCTLPDCAHKHVKHFNGVPGMIGASVSQCS